MNAEEWFTENGYDKVGVEICPTYEKVEGYPGFYKDKLKAAFNAGSTQVEDECCKKLKEKDIIINFLKKELVHKTAYKNVMKRQYRELREKYDAVKPRVEVQVDVSAHLFAWFDVTNWSDEEAKELTNLWKEIEKRHNTDKKFATFVEGCEKQCRD